MLWRSSLLFLITMITVGCSTYEPCQVEIGWTAKQVIACCGEAQDFQVIATEYGKVTQWIYHYYDAFLGYRPDISRHSVLFRSGKVVGVKY